MQSLKINNREEDVISLLLLLHINIVHADQEKLREEEGYTWTLA